MSVLKLSGIQKLLHICICALIFAFNIYAWVIPLAKKKDWIRLLKVIGNQNKIDLYILNNDN